VLRGSGHGRAIDTHEAVFRTNMAPTVGYEDDVGGRTTFDFVNLQHSKAFTPHVRAGGQEVRMALLLALAQAGSVPPPKPHPSQARTLTTLCACACVVADDATTLPALPITLNLL
jgi:hypothetical protein